LCQKKARRQEENIRKYTGEVNTKDIKGDAEDGEPWEFFLWTRSGVYNIKVCGVKKRTQCVSSNFVKINFPEF
jgi:hypothetical protein